MMMIISTRKIQRKGEKPAVKSMKNSMMTVRGTSETKLTLPNSNPMKGMKPREGKGG